MFVFVFFLLWIGSLAFLIARVGRVQRARGNYTRCNWPGSCVCGGDETGCPLDKVPAPIPESWVVRELPSIANHPTRISGPVRPTQGCAVSPDCTEASCRWRR